MILKDTEYSVCLWCLCLCVKIFRYFFDKKFRTMILNKRELQQNAS